MKISPLLRCLFVMFLLAKYSVAQAQTVPLRIETLSNAQIKTAVAAVKAGKKATALVATPAANGSAFCIHESGIFATNAHVVEGFSQVKVVVYPGETTQRTLTVRVSHYDEDSDLAVLIADPPLQTQAPEMSPLMVLPLGDSNTLFETMPVAVFGFPLGTDLALDDHEMPSVTVTTGRVTALRKLQGKLKEVQLDAAINPGNSGGPVINEKGQVIGIIYAGIDGAQALNFAIPIEKLSALLAVPGISIVSPPFRWADRRGQRQLTIQVKPLPQFAGVTPGAQGKYEMDVAVGDDGNWRELIVNRTSDIRSPVTEFMAIGSIFKGVEVPHYKITLRQDGKILAVREGEIEVIGAPSYAPAANNLPPRPVFPGSTRVPEMVVAEAPTIQNPRNGHWYRCVNSTRALSWNEAKTAAETMTYKGLSGHLVTITTADEQQFLVDSVLTNLPGGYVMAWIGGAQKEGAVEPDRGWGWTTQEPWKYSNWSPNEPNDQGDEDFIQISPDGSWNDSAGTTYNSSAFLVEFEPPISINTNTPPIDTPQVEGDKTTINLPGPIMSAVAGGSGRFLLFYLKTEQKVAIFDAQEKKIVRYLPAPGDNVQLAAGQQKLLLLLTDQNILQRWDIQTGQREQSTPLPNDKAITSMAMGAASSGPLLIIRDGDVSFIDPKTLQTMTMTDELDSKRMNLRPDSRASASVDGGTFAIGAETGGSGTWILHLEGNQISKAMVPAISVVPMPSVDGRWCFTSRGIFTSEGKPVVAEQLLDDDARKFQVMVPAFTPAFFVALKNRYDLYNTNPGRLKRVPKEVMIYNANDRRALLSLGLLDELSDTPRGILYGRQSAYPPLEKRVYYLPDRNMLVTIANGMDQLVIRQVDLRKLMSQDGRKYFYVASTPPRTATKGSSFTYQLDVVSEAGGTKYKVESGPPGLSINPTGRIEWQVPADFAAAEVAILITISDKSGQEMYHSFQVQIK